MKRYQQHQNPKQHALTRHIVEVHEENNQKKFMCHLCSSVFTRETALKNHILIHEGKKPFKYKENEEIGENKCPWCFSVFQEKDDLSKHILTKTFCTHHKLRQCSITIIIK